MEEESKVYYFHGKLNDDTRYTVAGEIYGEDLHLGFSICSKRDQFCKKTGRVKATGKMMSKSFKGRHLISLYGSDSPYKVKKGHAENYWVGAEAQVFLRIVQFVVNEIATRQKLQKVFRL
jgi:hypothetical protein